MHRIDAPGHVANAFVDGNPATGVLGTRVDASWLNALQEELAYVIEQSGITLVEGTNTQLLAALYLMSNNRFLQGKTTGGAIVNIIGMNNLDEVDVGRETNKMYLRNNGELLIQDYVGALDRDIRSVALFASCNITGAGAILNGDFNIASIAKQPGLGHYRINLTTAASSAANMVPNATKEGISIVGHSFNINRVNASTVDVYVVRTSTDLLVDASFTFTLFDVGA